MVPVSTIICCVITLAVCLVLPVAAYIFYGIKNKGKGIWSAWLIGAAGFGVLIGALFHSATLEELSFANLGSMIGVEECILFAVLLFATNKWKKHPIFYIVLSAVVGIIFAL